MTRPWYLVDSLAASSAGSVVSSEQRKVMSIDEDQMAALTALFLIVSTSRQVVWFRLTYCVMEE